MEILRHFAVAKMQRREVSRNFAAVKIKEAKFRTLTSFFFRYPGGSLYGGESFGLAGTTTKLITFFKQILFYKRSERDFLRFRVILSQL